MMELKATIDFLKTEGSKYLNQWVAIANGKLLGTSNSYAELIDNFGKHKDVVITRMNQRTNSADEIYKRIGFDREEAIKRNYDMRQAEKWNEVHEIFLHIGDALMSIGTNANMGQDWYAMVDKLVDRGVTIAYDEKQKW